jgi:hypothetical protein
VVVGFHEFSLIVFSSKQLPGPQSFHLSSTRPVPKSSAYSYLGAVAVLLLPATRVAW